MVSVMIIEGLNVENAKLIRINKSSVTILLEDGRHLFVSRTLYNKVLMGKVNGVLLVIEREYEGRNILWAAVPSIW